MSDEKKIENEKINYTVHQVQQTYANETERELRELGTESSVSVSDKSGN